MSKYVQVKVGDRVVEFLYINIRPLSVGTVIATSEHFAEVLIEGSLFRTKKWISKADLEIVTS